MKRAYTSLCLLLVCFVTVQSVAAQDTCPAIVQSALATVETACETAGRNQACYGYVAIDFVPQEGVTGLVFAAPGDMVDTTAVQTLHLSPMDSAAGEWGVALMKLQANLPDTLPGQNVTFLLFGDVELTNASAPVVVTLDVTSTGNINVRSGPSKNDGVITSLANGQVLPADGRSEAGDWLRIQLDDSKVGWVFASLVTFEGDVSTLAVVDPAETTFAPARPTAAFYFKSGVSDAPCEQAPDSGILVQTPEGAAEVTFTVNDVDIALSSTAYLQAEPGGEMTVNLIEGLARVTTLDTTVFLPAGTRARIPLDAEGIASGAPVGPEPYEDASLAALPIAPLEREITIAPALTEAEIQALLLPGAPTPGIWHKVLDQTTVDCGSGGATATRDTKEYDVTLTVIDKGTAIMIGDLELARSAEGLYTGSFSKEMKDPATGNVIMTSQTTYTYEVIAPDQIRGKEEDKVNLPPGQCIAVWMSTLTLTTPASGK